MHKAVFLDRDGTMARDVPYCSRPEDFELLPGVADGIKVFNNHGFKVVVVTNQSGVARGFFTEQTLTRIHDRMRRELAKCGVHLDAVYYCPHHPDDNCTCRKPKPEMAFQAARDFDIDLSKSYVIGDSEIDMEFARNAGCKAAVRISQSASGDSSVVPSFKDAVEVILGLERRYNL